MAAYRSPSRAPAGQERSAERPGRAPRWALAVAAAAVLALAGYAATNGDDREELDRLAPPDTTRPAEQQPGRPSGVVGAGTVAAPDAAPPFVPTADDLIRAAEPGTALALLGVLPVRDPAPGTPPGPSQFGPAWADVDGNGCDTRNDVLRRDLTGHVVQPGTAGCAVVAGRLVDPYTGTPVVFTATDADAVAIDHVVSLSDAWQTGAQAWPAPKRLAFANDPLNLLAVSAETHAARRDADAPVWLPPADHRRCAAVARRVAVKAEYELWLTPVERAVLARVLARCPSEPVPSGG